MLKKRRDRKNYNAGHDAGYVEGYAKGYIEGLHDGNPFIRIAEGISEITSYIVKTIDENPALIEKALKASEVQGNDVDV